MKAIQTVVLFGAALLAACSDRQSATAPTGGAVALASAGFIDVGADATASTSVMPDPIGDAANKAADYQDVVRVGITKKGQTFVFEMELAAPLPDTPPLPSWADVMLWEFVLDTDPTTFPEGYPFTKNSAPPFEFQVQHRVYRSGFTDPNDPTSGTGILVDRRPLLNGGRVSITPVQFTIEGAKLTWVVDAAALGDPSTFRWTTTTAAAHAGDDVTNGYNNVTIFDIAPDVGATWPQ